jgi:putative RNA 2'-phosphotransferase
MPPDPLTATSKALALLLRHDPHRFGVSLDAEGWADVAAVLAGLNAAGFDVDDEKLGRIVASDEKARYAMASDGSRIRARQGHSVRVDLGLVATKPPDVLYHGTVQRFVESILREGLLPRQRRFVHLSKCIEDAVEVGRRRGPPVVLVIDAAAMHRDGVPLRVSENGVWLVERVPSKYICPSA